MKFAVLKNCENSFRDEVANSVINSFIQHGHEISSEKNGIQFVLNLTDLETPFVFKRRSKSVFVISIIDARKCKEDLRSMSYTALIRTLSNLLISVSPGNCMDRDKVNGSTRISFTTPEVGFYDIPFDPEEIYKRIIPVAGSHFATENEFSTDLPERFYNTSSVVEKIKHYGKELDELGVLPTPFPLSSILPKEDMEHLYRIFGITGASYGNLSAREDVPELSKTTFWMTGRGVNKSQLSKVGKDILLVKGFDLKTSSALLSMPANFDSKARVSVDVVEHYLIYKTFPEAHAIVHIHAWMDGVLCTQQNYPCGTIELAKEVVELLRRTKNPSLTVVGLKNHGLTITGNNLDEIFDRIRGRLLTNVPMFS
jgi:ribulose-5-phosphate 4-epimerase/fuculose-1-phosphate aldolase